MEKFTKTVKTQNNEIKKINVSNVYQNDDLTIKEISNNFIIDEVDTIFILPYFKDDGYVLLQTEHIIAWNEKYKDKPLGKTSNFLNVIHFQLNEEEEIINTVRKGLYNESGLALNQFYNFEIDGPYFISNNSTKQYYYCLMELNLNDFKILSNPLKNKTQETLRVSIADLDEIRINNIMSKVLIDKMKIEYNL